MTIEGIVFGWLVLMTALSVLSLLAIGWWLGSENK